jgi:tryptophan-rich sensory protein
VFGPVWTLLYTMIAWAGARAWWRAGAGAALAGETPTAEARRRHQRRLLAAFLLNALLNMLWSVLFFKAQRPDWALAEIALLTVSVLWLIRACGRVDRLASRLLLPYLAWVLFAATVNAGVLQLNPLSPGV